MFPKSLANFRKTETAPISKHRDAKVIISPVSAEVVNGILQL